MNTKIPAHEIAWETYEGRLVTLGTIDHQHLSNCYWYSQIFPHPTQISTSMFKDELDRRFDGKLLEYVPKADFGYELMMLRKKKMLIQKNDSDTYLIFFNNQKIGHVTLI